MRYWTKIRKQFLHTNAVLRSYEVQLLWFFGLNQFALESVVVGQQPVGGVMRVDIYDLVVHIQ